MGVERMQRVLRPRVGRSHTDLGDEAGQSVSAWLGDAARDRLRLEALGEAVAAWEDEYGPLTEAEVAAAHRSLERPARRGRVLPEWAWCWTRAG